MFKNSFIWFSFGLFLLVSTLKIQAQNPIADLKDAERIENMAVKFVKSYGMVLDKLGGISLNQRADFIDKIIQEFFWQNQDVRVINDICVGCPSLRDYDAKQQYISIFDYLHGISNTYNHKRKVRFVYNQVSPRYKDLLKSRFYSKRDSTPIVKIKVGLKLVQGYRKKGENNPEIERDQLEIFVKFRDKKGTVIQGITLIRNYREDAVNRLSIPKKYMLSLNLGGSTFSGDISTSFTSQNPRSGYYVGVDIRRQMLVPRFSLGLSLNFIRLRGEDRLSQDTLKQIRNLNFRNNALEASLYFRYDLYKWPINKDKTVGKSGLAKGFYYQRRRPYIFAGGGLIWHSPRATYGEREKRVRLRDFRTENRIDDYEPFVFIVYGGLGYEWKNAFYTPFNIAAEVSVRLPFTDYLDDVRDEYVNIANLPNNISRDLADRSKSLNPSDPRLTATTYKGTDGITYKTFMELSEERNNSVRRAFDTRNDFFVLFGIKVSYSF